MRMPRCIAGCLAVLSIWGISSDIGAAQEPQFTFGFDQHLATITDLSVEIDDQVNDGCMPRPAAVKEAVETEVIRAGLRLSNEAAIRLTVRAFGFAAKSGNEHIGCVVSVEVTLRGPIAARVPIEANEFAIVVVPFSERHQMLVGPKDGMQDRIRSVAIEDSGSILLEIIKISQG